jgi:hypothetical protein
MLMLDLKTQSHLVDATASIMRAYLRATSDTLAASAGRSWWLWAQLLGNGSPRRASLGPAGAPQFPSLPLAITWLMPVHWPWLTCGPGMTWPPLAQMWWVGPSLTFWAPCADWSQMRDPFPLRSRWSNPTPAPPLPTRAEARSAPDTGFASYRSAGGHAVAQVTVPTVDQLAEVTTKVSLSPVQTMFSVWRAALGD